MHPLKPMLAKAAALPEDQENYAYEVKWDGIRAIVYLEKQQLKIFSRNQLDVTAQYPELQQLALTHSRSKLILDGEIVALDQNGQPSFSLLQQRMHLSSPRLIQQISHTLPVTYIIFDLLACDDRVLITDRYTQRRAVLETLQLSGPHWQTPGYKTGSGTTMLKATGALGLEGIVAKHLDSTYHPGKRSGDWLKVKHSLRQELLIGGWLEGQGSRSGTIGSLLLGYYAYAPQHNWPQKLKYAGKVGSGFNAATLLQLKQTLQHLRCPTSPFDGATPKGAIFVEPELVGEIQFTEWTSAGTLRHPVFKGLRTDKPPRTVVREAQ